MFYIRLWSYSSPLVRPSSHYIRGSLEVEEGPSVPQDLRATPPRVITNEDLAPDPDPRSGMAGRFWVGRPGGHDSKGTRF